MKIYKNVTETIGHTPLVKINNIGPTDCTILAKLEFFNPTSCVKERIALSMINAAEESGALKPGGLIVEPTSGNTGIGLATVAAARGYKLIVTMPESMSIERRKVLVHLGAEIVLTPAADGMKGAISKAEEIRDEQNAFMPQQFDNPANPDAHYKTTAPEIWNDTDGKVDAVVCGVGTGGTLTGIGRYLKEKNPAIKIFAVEPIGSAVINGGSPGPHGIQGIGAGFIPGNLDVSLIEQTIDIADDVANEAARELAKKEGLFAGISSGAAFAAAVEVAKKPELKGKNIVVILPDTGERYLSTALFETV